MFRKLSRIVVITLALFSVPVYADTGICSNPGLTIPFSECQALQVFYTATNGNNWDINTNWGSSTDVNSRYGVTVVNGHVTALQLQNNSLIGTVPEDIGDLPELTQLDLRQNSIISLPDAIGSLPNLLTLNMRLNILTTLPDGIAGADSIIYADFSYNSISSLPSAVGDMESIDYMDLSNNDLTSLPNSLGGLLELDSLILSHNDLASLPTSIGSLPDINSLDLGYNHLTVLPNEMGNLNTLQDIDLSYNDLTELPSAVGGWSSLVTFDASNNQLTTLPESIEDRDLVETIYLNHNLISDIGNEIDSLDSLDRIYLNNNELSDIPDFLGESTSLRYVFLQYNDITGTFPSFLMNLSGLIRFYTFGNKMDRNATHEALVPASMQTRYDAIPITYDGWQDDVTPPSLGFSGILPVLLTGSTTFDISVDENSYAVDVRGGGMPYTFTGAGLCQTLPGGEISQNTGYVSIPLTLTEKGVYQSCKLTMSDHGGNSSNQITLPSFVYSDVLIDFCDHPNIDIPVQECVALVSLYAATNGPNWANSANWLESTNLDDWFGVRIREIDGDNHVTGVFLNKSFGVDEHGLSTTWNGNNLVGVIPSVIGDLTYVTDLNLSKNPGLIGAIPIEIGTMERLKMLYARDTGLGGTLPSTIQNITTLEHLLIDANEFVGSFPSWLENMDSLQLVNLADNLFSGSLTISGSGFANLWYLNLQNNEFSGGLPAGLGSVGGLQYLYLANNDFVGPIPPSWSSMGNLETLQLQNNALDRTNQHFAKVGATIYNRYIGLNQSNISSQRDITPPTISGTGSIPWLVSGSVSYSLTITENSYAIDLDGDAMPVVFSGNDSLCQSLSGSSVATINGTTEITLEATQIGLYEDCLLGVEDHGGNVSNRILLPRFGYTTDDEAICFHPDLTISVDSCIALMEFYASTNGDSWFENGGRGSDYNVDNWYGVSTMGSGPEHVYSISLPNNNLAGTARLNSQELSDLEVLDLSQNGIDRVTSSWSGYTAMRILRLAETSIGGELPTYVSYLPTLEEVDFHGNDHTGEIPNAWSTLHSLEKVDISDNQLEGTFPSWFAGISSLTEISFQENNFQGTIPETWVALDSVTLLDISYNELNRTVLNTALLSSGVSSWTTGILVYRSNDQDDTIAPTISLSGSLPESVMNVFTMDVLIDENSYAIKSSGSGMVISFVGNGRCLELTTPDTITVMSGMQTVTVIPGGQGLYRECELVVTDNGGNQGILSLDDFTYSFTCGNAELDDGEECDEGRFCPDGSDCTDNPALCPGSCETRFVDGCTPVCLGSRCGDGFVDADGVDNLTGTIDDEICDEGSYCQSNGADCTLNASICPGGPSACQPRLINGCTPICSYATCGDGFVDLDGEDGILGNDDDEQCDDGNLIDGDGCHSTCLEESCGDGYVDPDGIDGEAGTMDDESCDLGASNGVIGGTCTTSCTTPADSCFNCSEVCTNGFETNSVFLMIDISGSMNGYERLDKTKDAHHLFLDMMPDTIYSGGVVDTGSIAGIVVFSNSATLLSDPTDDILALSGMIEDLEGTASTNYADALQLAYDYYATVNDADGKHIVFLSDGEPTHPGGKKNASDAAIDVANDIKNLGVEIYTVALQQTDNGADLLREISSGSGYSYEDPNNTQLNDIYTEIFGSIHCDCFGTIYCPVCGDLNVEYGEQCDLGSRCDNGDDCTGDPSICPTECKPRFIGQCTDECVFTYCGDGVVQTPNYDGVTEACDDSNGVSGDGCNSLCEEEICGDGFHDPNGPDNIWLTTDDEQCDDGNDIDNDDCANDCTLNTPNPIDGVCHDYGEQYAFAGDGSNAPDLGTLCDAGTATGFIYEGVSHQWNWYCLGEAGGSGIACSTSESFCGDGITQVLTNTEECDDGNDINGDGCSSTCQLEVPFTSYGIANECFVGKTPVVQTNEPLPIVIELSPVAGIDTGATSCSTLGDGKIIPGSSLSCSFGIYHGNDLAHTFISTLSGVNCIRALENTSFSGTILDFAADHLDHPERAIGFTVIPSFHSFGNSLLGKYRVVLEDVSYTYCGIDENSEVIEKSVLYGDDGDEPPICNTHISLTDPYLTQKGSSFGTLQPTSFESYVTADGSNLLYDGVSDSIKHNEVDSYSTDIVEYFTQTFTSNIRRGALDVVSVFGSDRLLKKVPYKNVFFFKGTSSATTITLSAQLLADISESFTLIVEDADLIVEGSLEGNGLYIVKNGKIIFDHQDCDRTQNIEGIFVTNEGFELTNTQNRLNRGEWCLRGNFSLKGILIGPGIDESIVNTRRAVLDLVNMTIIDNQELVQGLEVKEITNQQKIAIYESAAISIQTDPSVWRDLPEGTTYLFDAMTLYKE